MVQIHAKIYIFQFQKDRLIGAQYKTNNAWLYKFQFQ